jgi:hypothetical protein
MEQLSYSQTGLLINKEGMEVKTQKLIVVIVSRELMQPANRLSKAALGSTMKLN